MVLYIIAQGLVRTIVVNISCANTGYVRMKYLESFSSLKSYVTW